SFSRRSLPDLIQAAAFPGTGRETRGSGAIRAMPAWMREAHASGPSQQALEPPDLPFRSCNDLGRIGSIVLAIPIPDRPCGIDASLSAIAAWYSSTLVELPKLIGDRPCRLH
ncbi:MAG: hypothetical protein WAS49_05435, partial [Candidatus Dechloromonas phosphoritropha]